MEQAGRFLAEDPLGFAAGDANLYRYVFNQPTRFTDPSGMEWVWPWDRRANWRDWRIGEALFDIAYGFVDGFFEPVRIAGDTYRAIDWLVRTEYFGQQLPEPEWRSWVARNAPQTNDPQEWNHYVQQVYAQYALDSGVALCGYGVLRGAGLVWRRYFRPEPHRIYSARVLIRMAEEPGPYHNFPMSFDAVIFRGKRTLISERYVLYTRPGYINNRPGTYEIGVIPSASGRNEVIVHRFFRPDKIPTP